MTKAEYLRNPCRASSIPYWKAARITVPEGMQILHDDAFTPDLLQQYTDDPYFRLRHDLLDLKQVQLSHGFSLSQATLAEFVSHINACYGTNSMTEAQLEAYTTRSVYNSALWIAVRDDLSGEIVATGIAELDREMSEGILEWIQVSDGYRGRGLGSFIVAELLWRMKGMANFVTVSGRCNNPSNPEALYRKCGFTGHDVWHILKLSM